MCERGRKGFEGNFIEVQNTGRRKKESCVVSFVVGKKRPSIRLESPVLYILGGESVWS